MCSRTVLAGAFALVLATAAPVAATPGSLDNGFGSGGTLLRPVGDGGQSSGNGIALAPSGGLRMAGEALDSGESRLFLMRLDENGSPASASTTLTSLGGDAAAAAVVTAPDGGSVVAGYGFSGGGNVFGFARYLDDGTLDTSGFGAGGTRTAALGPSNDSSARAIAPYGQDQLVAAGRALTPTGRQFGIVRLLPGGTIDGAFTRVFPVGDGGEAAAD